MPYTYLIGWTNENLWYYGVQHGKNSSPENLWKTYFTSSKKVKYLRKQIGEPDVIKIRRVFDTAKEAIEWEHKVIKRMRCVEKEEWLNMTDNTGKFYWVGPRGSFSESHRKKLSEKKMGRKLSPEHKEKLHNGRRGKKNSPEHIQKIVESVKGRKNNEEQKKNISIAIMEKTSSESRKERATEAGKISAEKRKQDPVFQEKHRERMKQWWADRKKNQ